MRLDALIIFPVERCHNIVILIGKRLKYCKLSFMQAIHAGYPCRLFIQVVIAKPSFFWRNAGNTAKRCGLMRWSFFLLNDVRILSFWFVNYRNAVSYRSCRLFMQAIHAGHLFSLFIQAVPSKPNMFWKNAGNTAKRCGLMHWSFFPLNDFIILSFW